MADEKKISTLTEASDASSLDEFVVVNKDVVVGQDAGATGQTSKITLDNLRNAILGGSGGSTGNDVIFDGKVGIGTTNSPNAPLEISTDSDEVLRLNQGAGEPWNYLGFYQNDVFKGYVGSIGSEDSYPPEGSSANMDGGLSLTSLAGENLYLRTAPGTGNPTDTRLTILNSNGNVGIGTNWPFAPLHIEGTTTRDASSTDALSEAGTHDLSVNAQIRIQEKLDTVAQGRGTGIAFQSKYIQDSVVTPYLAAAIDTWKESTVASQYGSAMRFFTHKNGGSYAVERMRITSTGNVGIGTSDPNAKLCVQGIGVHPYTGSIQGFNNPLNLRNEVSTDGELQNVGMSFELKTTGNSFSRFSWIGSVQDQANARYSSLVFGTDEGTSTQPNRTEKMRIKYNGNVGIGTSSPSAKLDVTDDPISSDVDLSPRKVLCLKRPDVTTTTYAQRVNFFVSKYEGSETAGISTQPRTQLDIALSHSNGENDEVSNVDGTNERLGGTQVMTLRSDGNVGIGTDSPDWLLDVAQKDGGCQLQLGRTNTNVGSAWMGADSNGFHLGVGAYDDGGGIATDPNGFTVDTVGNVGIGTDPGHRLNVSDGTVNFKINPITDHATWGTEAQIGTVTNHTLKIQTNNITRMTFDTDDNVGIATATPHGPLEVRDSTSNCIVYITSGSTSHYSQIAFCHDVDTVGNILERASIRGKYASNGGGQLDFYTDNTGDTQVHRMTIGNNGVVHINGNLTTTGTASSVGLDARNLENVRASEASGLDNINNLVVSDFEKDGVTKVGIVAQDMQKVLPQSVSDGEEYEAVAVEAIGRVVTALGTDDEHEYCPRLKKSDFENPEYTWDEGAEFVETKAEETETRLGPLATSNDELIATLVKAVQELSAKVDELSK